MKNKKEKLMAICPCPRVDLHVNVTFYGDDAEVIRELSDELDLGRDDLVRRLSLMGLAQLLDEGAPIRR